MVEMLDKGEPLPVDFRSRFIYYVGPIAIDAIRKHQSVYLMAVGGAAYLVSKATKAARVVGFADLGMEAIYEFTVQDKPVMVAVDFAGTSVHETGPKEWKVRIGKIPVVVEAA